MESAWFIYSHQLFDLSPQQIIDCSGQGSCAGGNAGGAFNYAMKHNMMMESRYKYVGRHNYGGCKYNPHIVTPVKVHTWKNVEPNSVDQLKAAVHQQPITVTMKADLLTFRNGTIVI